MSETAGAILGDFDWEERATTRPPVAVEDYAGEKSEKFFKTWRHNAWLREPIESEAFRGRNGDESASTRAWNFAYRCGRCGVDQADTARALLTFYEHQQGADGVLKARRTMAATLRSWVQGHEEAEAQAEAMPGNGHGAAQAEAPVPEDETDTAPRAEDEGPREGQAMPAAGPVPAQTPPPEAPDLTIGADAFLAAPPPLTWDVESVRVQGDHGWTGGAPKSMKGLISLEEARAQATGTLFLNKFSTRRARVLYASEEDRRERLHRRYHAMLAGRVPEETPGPDDLRFLIKAGVRLDTKAGVKILRDAIARHRSEVVILEHFDKLHAKDPNKPEQMKPLLDALDRIHQDLGCVFRVQKHNKKTQPGQGKRTGEMLAGTIALFGWGESSMYLTLLRKGLAMVECEAKDGDTAGRFLVQYEAGRLVYAGDVGASHHQTALRDQNRTKVLDAVLGTPGITVADVVGIVKKDGKGMSEKTIRGHLESLETEGKLLRRKGSFHSPDTFWPKSAENNSEEPGSMALFPGMTT